MRELAPLGDVQTMSSREIAELTGKRHDNVLRDIDAISSNLSESSKSVTYKGYNNKTQREWLLSKRDTLLLVSGYSGGNIQSGRMLCVSENPQNMQNITVC